MAVSKTKNNHPKAIDFLPDFAFAAQLLDFLKQMSGFLSKWGDLIASLLVATGTLALAWQTYRSVDELKAQRHESYIPHFDIFLASPTSDIAGGFHLDVVVRNYGPGTATRVKVLIAEATETTATHQLEFLVANDEHRFPVEYRPNEAKTWTISLAFEDILGRAYPQVEKSLKHENST